MQLLSFWVWETCCCVLLHPATWRDGCFCLVTRATTLSSLLQQASFSNRGRPVSESRRPSEVSARVCSLQVFIFILFLFFCILYPCPGGLRSCFVGWLLVAFFYFYFCRRLLRVVCVSVSVSHYSLQAGTHTIPRRRLQRFVCLFVLNCPV